MNIENPRITISQNGSRWAITVTATEVFTPQELAGGFEFEDWVTLWEWDVSDHDHILDWRTERYQPTQGRHFWRWIANVPGDALDTELGGEEIRAEVFIRNVTTSSAPVHGYTPIVQISPD